VAARKIDEERVTRQPFSAGAEGSFRKKDAFTKFTFGED
jgi:hypothetical protein